MLIMNIMSPFNAVAKCRRGERSQYRVLGRPGEVDAMQVFSQNPVAADHIPIAAPQVEERRAGCLSDWS